MILDIVNSTTLADLHKDIHANVQKSLLDRITVVQPKKQGDYLGIIIMRTSHR